MNKIKNGVWPTMLTLFDENNKIDYNKMENLVEWYIANGVSGLFAICQSSEMFFLSLDEKIELIKFIRKITNDRVPIVASGHTSFDMKTQIYEMNKIAQTSVDAVVLISNILAGEERSEDNFKKNTEILIKSLPDDTIFGIYECPHPFKYLVSKELLKFLGETGKFKFLKDTCCDIDMIRERIEIAKCYDIKIYNANSATLLDSLNYGGNGFSGVMANLYPQLFVWLCENFNKEQALAKEIQNFIGVSSLSEYLSYPLCAKYWHNQKFGSSMATRSRDIADLKKADITIIKQLDAIAQDYLKKIK